MSADERPPIDFWFDFISPYGHLASLRIDALAARHGRDVRWRPLLLGVTVLKTMGLKPLMDTPLKRDYVVREIARQARHDGVVLGRDLTRPPMNPLPVARAFAWLLAHAPAHAKPFARQALHAYWGEGMDVDTPAALQAVLARAGVPEHTARPACEDPAAATLLRTSVDDALRRGAFGSPFIVVDGEPFWGVDKLPLVDEWLARGGW